MSAPETDLADAVHRIRERAIRQAMAVANHMSVPSAEVHTHLGVRPTEADLRAFRLGHAIARQQIYDALERMIAKEAPPEVRQAGYTSDGLEDGE